MIRRALAVLVVASLLAPQGWAEPPVEEPSLTGLEGMREIGRRAGNAKLGPAAAKTTAGIGFDNAGVGSGVSAVRIATGEGGRPNPPRVGPSRKIKSVPGEPGAYAAKTGSYNAESPHMNWDRAGTLKAASVGLGLALIGFAVGGPIGAAVGFLAGFFAGAAAWKMGYL